MSVTLKISSLFLLFSFALFQLTVSKATSARTAEEGAPDFIAVTALPSPNPNGSNRQILLTRNAKKACGICPSLIAKFACERFIVAQQKIQDPRNKNSKELIAREVHSSTRSLNTLNRLVKDNRDGHGTTQIGLKYSQCYEMATGNTPLTHRKALTRTDSFSKLVRKTTARLLNFISERLPRGIEGNQEASSAIAGAVVSPVAVRDPIGL